MAAKKTIVVVGATGRQGGGVVDTFLDSDWHFRAMTRNPSAETAQALSAKGEDFHGSRAHAGLVKADVDKVRKL